MTYQTKQQMLDYIKKQSDNLLSMINELQESGDETLAELVIGTYHSMTPVKAKLVTFIKNEEILVSLPEQTSTPTKMITISQIKSRLKKVGLNLTHIEIKRGEIEIFVENPNEPGTALASETNQLAEIVIKVIGWESYYTGYGSCVLKYDYKTKGDWNDKSSKHHY